MHRLFVAPRIAVGKMTASPLRIGLVYDRFGDMPAPPGAPPDWDAEFEPEATVDALESAVRRLGHVPVRIGNPRALLQAIAAGGPSADAAINIAEGYGGRNREAYAPVLLELASIPFIGSDALTLSVTLDKHLSKLVMSSTPVATPAWRVVGMGPGVMGEDGMGPGGQMGASERHPATGQAPSHWPLAPSHPLAASQLAPTPLAPSSFPLIVKPRYEGTAKGIQRSSRCDTEEALRAEVSRQGTLYQQDLLVEAFVEGAEYTVAVVGEPPAALPALQRAIDPVTGIGVHALCDGDSGYELSGSLSPEMEARLHEAAVVAHRVFECRDFSRSDFRVDRDDRVWFLEINPLPTFAPDGTFAIIAELSGRPYDEFLADVIGGALRRIRA